MLKLREKKNLIKGDQDLETSSGTLIPDRIISRGHMPYTSRGLHDYQLWTPLEEIRLPKAATTSLNKSLKKLSRHISDKTTQDLVNILSSCRDFIDIYFSSTNTSPVFIGNFDKGTENPDVLRKLIHDAQVGLEYFRGEVISQKMQEHMTVTSLCLREVIAHTVGFNKVAHYPSQVKNKLPNYKLKAFLFDSHYSLGEGGNIIDCRNVAIED